MCGLSSGQIAAAFVAPEPTVAQRLTRAKRKIAEVGIPYRACGSADGRRLCGRLG
ncbi:hypothetical protein ABT294_08800 [Nonomuraea sp. NPDC000554]|uniref:hypothetical protein n=1 Tax=Nonomuraea sp. NPDC000554 TaxID=3154259 RepID=UPI00332B42C1